MSNISRKRKRLKTNINSEDDNQGKLKSFTSIVVKSSDLDHKSRDHNKDIEIRERSSKLLEDFDFNQKFGPCSEITRGQRLERAKKFGIPIDSYIEDEIKNNYDSNSIIDRLMTQYID